MKVFKMFFANLEIKTGRKPCLKCSKKSTNSVIFKYMWISK